MLKELASSLTKGTELSELGTWLAAQLRVVEYWSELQESRETVENQDPDRPAAVLAMPEKWETTKGIELWQWQRECADAWLANGRKGIAKVVTGAGKTVFALHVMERLQRETTPSLRVAVVVPTIVLMNQWFDALHRLSNLPRRAIGRLGGGHKDDLSEPCRILICVLNSASKMLPRIVDRSGQAEDMLLVVDECHRTRGSTMSRVFNSKRAYSLGLSATPEDDADDEQESADADVVTENLGAIIYELTVREAIAQGILSTFEIRHYGLPLEPDERQAYEKHSREIRELNKTLRAAAARSKSRASSNTFRFAQRLAAKGTGELAVEAAQYIQETRRRKLLLYRARNRSRAVLDLVRRSIERNPDARVLLFHESIVEVMQVYFALLREGFRVAVDHSDLADSIRSESIDLFRSGKAQVLVSARTLIEGFDVPAADVGIIVASSTSPRQRIQTIGRVLRKPKDGSAEKTGVIHSLYVARSTDEMLFEKLDLDRVIGAERNSFYLWTPPPIEATAEERQEERYQPVPQDGPPRVPKPSEDEIGWENLSPGDIYPGKYDGTEFHCDQQGNIIGADGRYVSNPQGIGDALRSICPKAAKFRVTPRRNAILCWDRNRKSALLVGFLQEEFEFTEAAPAMGEEGRNTAPTDASDSAGSYEVKRIRGTLRLTNERGRYALTSGQAQEKIRGKDAERVIEAVQELQKETGRPISKVEVDAANKAYCVVDGKRYGLCELEAGLEFH